LKGRFLIVLQRNEYTLFAEDLDHILEHTRDAWESLRGERIFITGGTGFFGAWLVESFLWANDRLDLGAKAVVLTRSPEATRRRAQHLASHPALHYHPGDVRSFSFPTGSFSHIIHAATAASAKLNNESPTIMLDTIVAGTQRVLEFAEECNAKRFLLTSSGAVYGRQPSELTHVAEDFTGSPDSLNPASAYGEGKRAAELLCAIHHQQYGLNACIARCFAFVGPYLPLDIHFAVGNFLRDALDGSIISVQGDGRPYRSYLYAADLAAWLWTILFRGHTCRPYNVGSDLAVSIAETANAVAKLTGNASKVHIAKTADATVPATRYVPSIERARRELDLDAWIPFDEALRRTFAWQQYKVCRLAG
jgi:dTDP-glucose 4,6-dehydratase